MRAVPCIRSNCFAPQSQHFQQPGPRRNRAGFSVHRRRPQRRTLLLSPGTDQVQWRARRRAAIRTAQVFPSTARAPPPPAANCGLKPTNHCRKASRSSIPKSREQVSGPGMPFSSFKPERLRQFPLGMAAKLPIGAGLAVAARRAKGDCQDVAARMAAGIAGAHPNCNIRQGVKPVGELGHSGITAASLHAAPRGVCRYHTEYRNCLYAIALGLSGGTIGRAPFPALR